MQLYIYFGNTPKIQAILEKRWGGGGEGEREREGERIKSPTYHRCFCKPFDPQGTERKSDFILCLNDSVCDLFIYSQRTDQPQTVDIFCPLRVLVFTFLKQA